MTSIRWPAGIFTVAQVGGRTYISAADLLAYIREIKTDSPQARQGLDGLARQIEKVV